MLGDMIGRLIDRWSGNDNWYVRPIGPSDYVQDSHYGIGRDNGRNTSREAEARRQRFRDEDADG